MWRSRHASKRREETFCSLPPPDSIVISEFFRNVFIHHLTKQYLCYFRLTGVVLIIQNVQTVLKVDAKWIVVCYPTETETHAHLNTSFKSTTSVKPFMTNLQNLFVALVNMDIFQMTPNLTYSLLTNKCNYEHIIVYADMQNVCRCIDYYQTFLKLPVNLNLRAARLPTPDKWISTHPFLFQ